MRAETVTRSARAVSRLARHRLVAAALLVAALVLLTDPVAVGASDVFSNVGPASQVPGGSLLETYPLVNYTLDHDFAAVEAGVFSGVDTSGVVPAIAWFLASVLWLVISFLAYATITLFTFAFSLDLLNGGAAGETGALAPVADAVRSIYHTMFGPPWLVLAITLTGLWAIWHALVRRRYTETAGALGLSVIFVIVALAFVSHPERTIGEASRWTNAMSEAFLSLSSEGDVTSHSQAKRSAADQLFALLVHEPWVVLQFGGREHCIRPSDGGDDDAPVSVAVRPLSRDVARDAELSRRLGEAERVRADGKVCINNRNKYAPRFLKYPPGSDERNEHKDALADGDAGKAPEGDREGYRLGPADTPAADAMGEDGQYQRLLMALVIFAGNLGAVVLVGALSLAVILVQVLVLLLLAFAPIALVLAVIPGRGHDFFRHWLAKLATFLLRKALYSLILAVLLAVVAAVSDATTNLGWLMGWGLQGAFFWAVLIWRKQLVGQLTRATTGRAAEDDGSGVVRLASLYAVAQMGRRVARRHRPGHGQPPPDPRNRHRKRSHQSSENDSGSDSSDGSSQPSRTSKRSDSDRRTSSEEARSDPAEPDGGRRADERQSAAPDDKQPAPSPSDEETESPLSRGLRDDARRIRRKRRRDSAPPPPQPPSAGSDESSAHESPRRRRERS